MIDKETASNLNLTGKNILRDNFKYSVNSCYEPYSNEYSNLILNSILSNENIIK